jgi:hypothetical protein
MPPKLSGQIAPITGTSLDARRRTQRVGSDEAQPRKIPVPSSLWVLGAPVFFGPCSGDTRAFA